MRFFSGALGLMAVCLALHASIVPTFHLDGTTLKAFQDYVARFEKGAYARFETSGKLWIDSACCGKHEAFESGKPVVEARENEDVAAGSIHHFSGALRVKGATIESVRSVMQDYANYVKMFKPDLGSASAQRQPDSTPEDEHYQSKMLLVQSTLWIGVTYDTIYDTHYRRVAKDRWIARSASLSIRELLDPKNPNGGTWPEGDDHGFLWKTNTYWFARERDGGLDLEADSISVSRPIPTGFAWWGTKRARDAVDKMLRDTRAALDAAHPGQDKRAGL